MTERPRAFPPWTGVVALLSVITMLLVYACGSAMRHADPEPTTAPKGPDYSRVDDLFKGGHHTDLIKLRSRHTGNGGYSRLCIQTMLHVAKDLRDTYGKDWKAYWAFNDPDCR